MLDQPMLNQLLKLLDEGVLDPVEVAKTALCWLDEKSLKLMAEVNEFIPPVLEEDE